MKIFVKSAVFAQSGVGEDRVGVSQSKRHTFLTLADGAGGMGGGDVAAERIVQSNLLSHQDTSSQIAERLSLLDRELYDSNDGGESTAIAIVINGAELRGASVGDSQAWLVVESEIQELTENQFRKPLVGSGMATPVSFATPLSSGRLLMASDGLFNYAKRSDILRVISESPLNVAAHSLVELVRLKNGSLHDDVSIVVCDFERGT